MCDVIFKLRLWAVPAVPVIATSVLVLTACALAMAPDTVHDRPAADRPMIGDADADANATKVNERAVEAEAGGKQAVGWDRQPSYLRDRKGLPDFSGAAGAAER